MMKLRVIAAALVLFAGFALSASAGEISKSALSSMGFSSLQKMSDNDGLAIRGMGGKSGTHAAVWGSGTANFASPAGNATETTGYEAGSQHKHTARPALGGNIALAGQASSGRHGSINFTSSAPLAVRLPRPTNCC